MRQATVTTLLTSVLAVFVLGTGCPELIIPPLIELPREETINPQDPQDPEDSQESQNTDGSDREVSHRRLSERNAFVPAKPGDGGVGRPVSFGMTLTQGTEVLFKTTVQIDPDDPLDPANPSFYKIVDDYHYRSQGHSNTAVYVSIWMDTPEDYLCNIGFAVRVGKSNAHWKNGNQPLFTLNQEEDIALTISDIQFEHQGQPRPMLLAHYPSPDTLASGGYMMHYTEYSCAYYDLPQALEYGNTLQVPQSAFMDHAESGEFWFEENSGWTPTVTWEFNSAPAYQPDRGFEARMIEGNNVYANGEVFELGTAAFAWLMFEAH